MKFSRLFKRSARTGVTGILTTGVIVAFGILSVTGAAALNPGLGWLVAAFVFGGMAEGEVYFQEIREGLKDLSIMGERGKIRLAIRSLDRALKKEAAPEGSFLAEYWALKAYLDDHPGKKASEEARTQKALAKKRLAMMEKYLAARLMGSKNKNDAFEDDASEAILNGLNGEQPSIRRKMHMIRASIPLGLIAGTGLGLGSAGLLSGVALTGVLGAMVGVGWPVLAAAGVIGSFFLMVQTAKEFIFSDWFADWKARIKRWFLPNGKITLGYVAKVAGLGLLIGGVATLCVLATLGTLGMSWPAAKLGLQLIPHLGKAVSWIQAVVVPVFVSGTFVFTTFKSMQTLQMIDDKLRDKSSTIKGQVIAAYQALRARENKLQMADPFRAITTTILYVVDAVLLLGHTIASGAGSNQFKGIPPAVLTGAAALNEGFQDSPFFFSPGNKTLISRLVFVLLSPVLLLSAAWQTAASQLNDATSGKPRLDFLTAAKQTFGFSSETSAEPVVAADLPAVREGWRTREIQKRFDKVARQCPVVQVQRTRESERFDQVKAKALGENVVGKQGHIVTWVDNKKLDNKLNKLAKQYARPVMAR